MTTAPLPEDVTAYLKEKNIPDLMEYLLHELTQKRPDRPVAFLRELLGKPITPKLLISGPPASGKGTQCEMIAEKFGVVHISTGDLLRAEVKNGTELGKQAEEFMKSGGLVPDTVIIDMVRSRLSDADVQERGWLLDGFPRTKAQAQALQDAGIVPQMMVLLDIADDVVIERVEGRRSDPVTGKVYHLKYNPPPEGDAEVLKRLVHRKDDTREAMTHRLTVHHKNFTDIMDFYTHITFKTDANRNKDVVAADVQGGIEARLLK